MKFYRVFHGFGPDGHRGYTWTTSRADARKILRDDADPDSASTGAVQPFEIEPTKAGILEALRQLASHPDNG